MKQVLLPFRVAVVPLMECSTTLAGTVTGGVLRSTPQQLPIKCSALTTGCGSKTTPTARAVVSLFVVYEIIDFLTI